MARYADWWNFNSVPVEEYARKLAILKQHCERIGRDPSEIKLTYLCTLSVSEDPTQVKRDPAKHFIAGNAAEVIHELEDKPKRAIRGLRERAHRGEPRRGGRYSRSSSRSR